MPIFKVTFAGSRLDSNGTQTRIVADIKVDADSPTQAMWLGLADVSGPIVEVSIDRVTIRELRIRGGRSLDASARSRGMAAGASSPNANGPVASKKNKRKSL